MSIECKHGHLARSCDFCSLEAEVQEWKDRCCNEGAAKIAALEAEVERLRWYENNYAVLAEHMAEVKAIADGDSTNTLQVVVEHCLAELSPRKEVDGE